MPDKEEKKAKKVEFKKYFEMSTAVPHWNISTEGEECAICDELIKEGDYFIEPPDRLNNHIYDKWCLKCWNDAHEFFNHIIAGDKS